MGLSLSGSPPPPKQKKKKTTIHAGNETARSG